MPGERAEGDDESDAEADEGKGDDGGVSEFENNGDADVGSLAIDANDKDDGRRI